MAWRRRLPGAWALALMMVSAPACADGERTPDDEAHAEASSAAAPSAAPSAPGAAPDGPPRPVVRGILSVAEPLAAEVPEGVLYLTVRAPAPEGRRGRAVLVHRVERIRLPYPFELTTEHLMAPGVEIPPVLVVEAAIDQDGDAISRSVGDLRGASAEVKRGDWDVTVTLDTRVDETTATARRR